MHVLLLFVCLFAHSKLITMSDVHEFLLFEGTKIPGKLVPGPKFHPDQNFRDTCMCLFLMASFVKLNMYIVYITRTCYCTEFHFFSHALPMCLPLHLPLQ